jgi:hypothetical protein
LSALTCFVAFTFDNVNSTDLPNMKIRLTQFITLTFVSAMSTFSGNAQSTHNLRVDLESSFNAFYSALVAKDPALFRNSLSQSTYMKWKNMMISSKSEFPQTFYQSASHYNFDFKQLQFLKAVESGPTGNAIYYDTKGKNTIILRFVKEDSAWKFGDAEVYGTEEIINQLKAKDMSFLEDKRYKPNGLEPLIQKEIKDVDYVAMLDRSGPYKISIWVNGVEQQATSGGSSSGLLLGGVKKGKNTIEIKFAPLEGSNGGSISVSIRAFMDEEPNEVLSVKMTTPLDIKQDFTVQ